MIDMGATTVVKEPTLAEEQSHFHLEPPRRSPLLDLPSVTLQQDNGRVTLEQIEGMGTASEATTATIPASTMLIDIVARARRAVERHPESVRVRASLGLALLNNNELDAASDVLAEVLVIDQNNYLAMGGLARVRLLQNRFDEARDLYLALREAHPHDPNPVMGLANVETQRGRPEEAVTIWERAVALAPDSSFPRYGFGLALLTLARPQEAIAQLRVAVRLDVRSAPLHHGLGVAYSFAGQPQRAIKEFKAALTLAPNMPEAVQGLASVWIEMHRFSAAESLLKEYLKSRLTSETHDAHELLAWAFVQQGQHREAKAELYQALNVIPRVGPDTASHRARLTNNLGVCFLLLGDHDEAYHRFESAIGIKPDDVAAPYLNLARVCLIAQRPDRAAAVLSRCVRYFPQDVDTVLLLAWCRQLQGRYDDAIQQLRQLTHTENAPLTAFSMLGGLLVDAKQDIGAALMVGGEARRRFGNDPLLINHLAYAHLMRGDIVAARTILASSPDLISGDAEIYLAATHGLLCLWEGDIEGGIRGYRQAARLAVQHNKATLIGQIRQKMHLELARTYVRLDMREAASKEVGKGLLAKGNDLYHRDLDTLAQMLQVIQR